MSGAFVDFYALLGLVVAPGAEPSSVSIKDINSRYKKLARKWHPDKNPDDVDAPARFEMLQSAIETLRDDVLRKAYDARYVARVREEVRNANMDASTRAMKLDLSRRERDAAERAAQKQAQDNNARILQQLRRDTETKMHEAAKAAVPSAPMRRIMSYDEHVAKETALLKRMRATAVQ